MKRNTLVFVLVLCFAVVGLCGCGSQDSKDLPVYTITYHLNGGSSDVVNPSAFNEKTPSFAISNPVRDGYVFSGWSVSSDLLSPLPTIEIAVGSTGSRSYYAVWRILPKLSIVVQPIYFDVNIIDSTLDWNNNATVILTPVDGVAITSFRFEDKLGNAIIPQSNVWDSVAQHYVVQFFMTKDLDIILHVVGGAV